MIRIEPDERCPCDSGQPFRRCCNRTNWIPLQAVTRTPVPKTNFSNPNCYAGQLRDCSQKLSAEHYIPKSILDILNANNSLTVSGFPWLKPGEVRQLNPAALTSKVLCKRHNEALSPLDAVALNLFKALKAIEDDFAEERHQSTRQLYLFNGTDFERWLVKTLIGTTLANNRKLKQADFPPVIWLNLLFGTQHFPPKWGFGFEAKVGESKPILEGISHGPLTDEHDATLGLHLEMKNYAFVVMMEPARWAENGHFLGNFTYRPKQLVFTSQNDEYRKVIQFGFSKGGSDLGVPITLRFNNN